jgi:hypothetical protein
MYVRQACLAAGMYLLTHDDRTEFDPTGGARKPPSQRGFERPSSN